MPAAAGTRHRRSTPYQAYRTADGFVTIGANNDRLWQRFARGRRPAPGVAHRPPLRDAAGPDGAHRRARAGDRGDHHHPHDRRSGWRSATRQASPADRCSPTTRHSPTRTSSPATWSSTSSTRSSARCARSAPALGSAALDFKVRGPAPWLGQHTAEVLSRARPGRGRDRPPVRRRRRLRRAPRAAAEVRSSDQNPTEDLVVERSGRGGAVATLVLNRPDSHNAIRLGMYEALPDLLGEIDQDHDVKVLVVRGAGQQVVRLRSRHQRVPRGARQRRDGPGLQRARRRRRAGARGAVEAHDRDGARLLHRRRLRPGPGLRPAVRRRAGQLRDHPGQARAGLQPRARPSVSSTSSVRRGPSGS